MPEYIAHYRAVATRLRAVADELTDAAMKEELLLLADRFERLAGYRERALKPTQAWLQLRR